MRATILAAAALAAAVAVGCKEEPKPAPAAKPAPATAPSAGPATMPAAVDAATKKAGEVAGDMTAKAQDLYDKAMEAVKKTDWDAAKGYVKQLDAIKGQLSPEWQSKIDSLQKTVMAAENPASLIPGGGSTSKPSDLVPKVPGL